MIKFSKELEEEVQQMDLKHKRAYRKLLALNNYIGSNKDLYFMLKRYYKHKNESAYKPTFEI